VLLFRVRALRNVHALHACTLRASIIIPAEDHAPCTFAAYLGSGPGSGPESPRARVKSAPARVSVQFNFQFRCQSWIWITAEATALIRYNHQAITGEPRSVLPYVEYDSSRGIAIQPSKLSPAQPTTQSYSVPESENLLMFVVCMLPRTETSSEIQPFGFRSYLHLQYCTSSLRRGPHRSSESVSIKVF
jgi:hypothetical protein